MEPGSGWRIIVFRKMGLSRSDGDFNCTFFDATKVYISHSTKWRHQILDFEPTQPGVRNELSTCNLVGV